MTNTSWTSPKTNIFSALMALRSALSYGMNARLIKMYNEDCAHPIRLKNKQKESDFKKYDFSIGYLSTRKEIQERTDLSDFEKYLSLNYKTCYGTPEAVEKYYNTCVVSDDNFKGMGRSHLVKVSDLVKFYNDKGDWRYTKLFDHYDENKPDDRHFYDFFRLKHSKNQWTVKKFKRKLWVVETLGKDKPKAKIPVAIYILNVLVYPLKYIPQRSILKMPDYTNYTFRVGSVTHGYKVEFQIPKKFNFK